MTPSLLWKQWEKTARSCGDKIVLIDAPSGISWTARDLTARVEQFWDELSPFRPGDRIGFRLSDFSGMALLLATQKLGLVAVPFDAGLPEAGCLELAEKLQIRALYWNGSFRVFDKAHRKQPGIVYLKTTSGSSAGEPKIIPCRAEHLLADGSQIIRSMGLRRSDHHLAVIPLGHSYGLGSLIMPLIMQGATVVAGNQFVPRQVQEWIAHFKVTVFPGVPALFRVLAALPGHDSFPSLRLAISAGAPLLPETARAFLARYGVKIHNFYGSTETGGISYDRTGAASLSGRSIGKPLNGVTITIRGGHIKVKSCAVTTRTGQWILPDTGEWNSRKELVLLGRSGESANIGGKKVHPVEVERTLRDLKGVMDVAVWVLRNGESDYLAAAVETKLSQRELELYLAEHLPAWKWPKRYFVAAELPRTGRGKLDAAFLRRKLGELGRTPSGST